MRTRCHPVAGGFLATALASGAAAQDRDPTAGYDARDILGLLPREASELPTREKVLGRPFTVGLPFDGVCSGTVSARLRES